MSNVKEIIAQLNYYQYKSKSPILTSARALQAEGIIADSNRFSTTFGEAAVDEERIPLCVSLMSADQLKAEFKKWVGETSRSYNNGMDTKIDGVHNSRSIALMHMGTAASAAFIAGFAGPAPVAQAMLIAKSLVISALGATKLRNHWNNLKEQKDYMIESNIAHTNRTLCYNEMEKRGIPLTSNDLK